MSAAAASSSAASSAAASSSASSAAPAAVEQAKHKRRRSRTKFTTVKHRKVAGKRQPTYTEEKIDRIVWIDQRNKKVAVKWTGKPECENSVLDMVDVGLPYIHEYLEASNIFNTELVWKYTVNGKDESLVRDMDDDTSSHLTFCLKRWLKEGSSSTFRSVPYTVQTHAGRCLFRAHFMPEGYCIQQSLTNVAGDRYIWPEIRNDGPKPRLTTDELKAKYDVFSATEKRFKKYQEETAKHQKEKEDKHAAHVKEREARSAKRHKQDQMSVLNGNAPSVDPPKPATAAAASAASSSSSNSSAASAANSVTQPSRTFSAPPSLKRILTPSDVANKYNSLMNGVTLHDRSGSTATQSVSKALSECKPVRCDHCGITTKPIFRLDYMDGSYCSTACWKTGKDKPCHAGCACKSYRGDDDGGYDTE